METFIIRGRNKQSKNVHVFSFGTMSSQFCFIILLLLRIMYYYIIWFENMYLFSFV